MRPNLHGAPSVTVEEPAVLTSFCDCLLEPRRLPLAVDDKCIINRRLSRPAPRARNEMHGWGRRRGEFQGERRGGQRGDLR